MKHLANNLEIVQKEVEKLLKSDKTGHSYDHIKRVVGLTTRLLVDEACEYTALMIAYLHEIFDDKLLLPYDNLDEIYETWGLVKTEHFSEIEKGIKSIGFKGGFEVSEKSLEAQIVSDADLLDAMGAIGIGRAFYYAGSKGQPFHDYELEGVVATDYLSYRSKNKNVMGHFDEKLLRLKDFIVTEKGKQIAQKRHKMLQLFYDTFYEELKEGDVNEVKD